MNNTISDIGFTHPCITIMFIIYLHHRSSSKAKINLLFTSSWIFFSFSFSSEVETGFDLLPSKLMYKPPSAFTLMPGSIRLDNSFLKQIGTNSSGGADMSRSSPLHTVTIICNNDVSEECGSTVYVCSAFKG